jgi:hypothetical protein
MMPYASMCVPLLIRTQWRAIDCAENSRYICAFNVNFNVKTLYTRSANSEKDAFRKDPTSSEVYFLSVFLLFSSSSLA